MKKKLSDTKTTYGDNPEWTAADFKKAVRIDGLPQSLQTKLREQRGSQRVPSKTQTDLG